MLYDDPFDPHRPYLEDILVAKLDLRPVESVLAALRADVRKDAMHRLLGLRHRVAGHDLADAPARPAVRPRRVRIARDHRAVQRIEPPHVVKAGDMVHVRMRQHDRVNFADAVLDASQTHFGRRVDQKADVAGRDIRPASTTSVARILRRADLAGAADLRHSHACPRP